MSCSLLRNVYSHYYWFFYEGKDPRTENFSLMSSPIPTFLILVSYMYFVCNLGPKLMKNRPAFNLNILIIYYNSRQILYNFYFVYYFSSIWWKELRWYCSPVDYSDDQLFHVHLYFIDKITDLLDTIYFVLRKKPKQVTTLHVIHHVGMVCISWMSTAFVGGGMALIYVLVNCTVHAIIYSYYLLVVWIPEYQKSIWWKRHITQLQLAQFVFVFVTFGQLLLRPSCSFPKSYAVMTLIACSLMMVMFGNFYYQTYVKPIKTKTK